MKIAKEQLIFGQDLVELEEKDLVFGRVGCFSQDRYDPRNLFIVVDYDPDSKFITVITPRIQYFTKFQFGRDARLYRSIWDAVRGISKCVCYDGQGCDSCGCGHVEFMKDVYQDSFTEYDGEYEPFLIKYDKDMCQVSLKDINDLDQSAWHNYEIELYPKGLLDIVWDTGAIKSKKMKQIMKKLEMKQGKLTRLIQEQAVVAKEMIDLYADYSSLASDTSTSISDL